MTANAKNLSTLANVLDDGTNGQFLQSTGSGGIVFADVAAGASVYDSAELLPLSGNDAGDMAYVNSTNRFYINNGTGWYSISLVNTNPNITSVQDASANTTPFTLATDGTATVITITANDPEQVPLTYNYSVTSGSLTNGGGTTATVTQSDNVFTVTPSTTEAYAGTFELTFTASDGINTATNANSFTLGFITIITNSKYTTLLASVASNSPYSLPSANNQVSSFSVNSQTSSPTEVVFGDSGTKMFVLSSDRYVYSYNLSTAYDASTASYVATSSELTQFSTNTSESFRFKPDGTVMFVSGSNGYVYQYSLTAWDVSTIAYASKSVQHGSHAGSYKAITFKPDGTRIYMSSLRYVMSMTLNSPWDLGSTSSDNTSAGFTNAYLNLGWVYGNTITGIDFNSTGTSLTMVYGNNSSDKYIIEHPIDDAWNVSNATVLGSAPTTTYQQNSIQGLAYANDGNTLVTVLDTGDTVYTYDTGMSGINNNIKDASTNNHSITVSGDSHAGTFSPYRSGGYSTLFGSNTNYGRYELTNNISLTGDFTIEFWFSGTEYTGRNQILGSGFQIRKEGNSWYTSISWPQGSYSIPNNEVPGSEWHWVQLIRSSGSAQLYIDGNTVGAAVANTTTYNLNSGYASKLIIGYEATSERLDGYLRDLRISNVARTAAIPTAPLELDSNTHVLLFNKGAQIAETGLSNTLTLTALGDPESHAIGPYDYTEYSAADYGGSMNFDGTGDYLTIPDHSSLNFGSNDWTIECWIYPRTNVGDCGIWHQSASGGADWFSIYLDGSFNPKFVLRNNNAEEWAGTAAANTAPQNTWTHIALVRRFGTDIKMYANGKVVHTETQHLNVGLEDKSYNHVIGYERFVGNGTYFDGLISDFKIDIGTAHYTGEFTPPTAPLSSTAADLHIKGTDASIIDKSQSANLNLFGNTTGSTTQVKFVGSKSMYFDGSGDGILCKGTQIPTGATESWTIEAWAYVTDTSIERQIFAQYSAGSSSTRFIFGVESAKFRVFNGGTTLYSLNAVSLNTWTHVAVTYNGSAAELYVDGISQGTLTLNRGVDDVDLQIGARNQGATQPWVGYIQDARVTKGLARYTANFTPPTASLEG